MSLIKCPECNKEISDKAKNCPNCGYELPKKEQMFQGVYCPSCLESGIKTNIDMCPYCHIRFIDSIYSTIDDVDNYGENHPELKQSPEFSEIAYQRRINYTPYEYNDMNNTLSCPYCKSPNTKKISGVSRMTSVGLFGLGSKKIGKQWHCNNCESDF